MTVKKVRSGPAPMLRAASSRSRSTAAKAAVVIQTAKTRPWRQCEIAELAQTIKSALDSFESAGRALNDTNLMYHMPYVSHEERGYLADRLEYDPDLTIWAACAVSSARCARVSYTPFDELKPNVRKDLELFKKLVSADPMHASPLEHPAISQHGDTWRAQSGPETIYKGWATFRAIWEHSDEHMRKSFFEMCDRVLK